MPNINSINSQNVDFYIVIITLFVYLIIFVTDNILLHNILFDLH